MVRARTGQASGLRLDANVRARLERAFDFDFSPVRVHLGGLAADLGVRACACGWDLYFAPGHYRPDDPAGQVLLAHELTHVVQQQTGQVANRFPTLEGVDVAIHETAETYMKSGESFLARLLPYWGVRLLLQLRILILPLLAVWLPVLKILPMVYSFRANRLLQRHYAALRAVEIAIREADTPDELRDRLRELERLRSDMEALSRKVPAHLQRDVYHWRLHVAAVRSEAQDRLARICTSGKLRA